MIRYHSNQIVNKGKKGKFTTKREVYHVVVNFFFLLAARRNFSYDQSFLPYNETGNEKGRTRNCGYTASMWRCQNLTAWSYVWNCPEVTFNIFASVCQRWSIFSLQEDHKDYLVNLEAIQVDNIRGKLYAGHTSFSEVRNQAYMHSSRQGKCLHFCRQLP